MSCKDNIAEALFNVLIDAPDVQLNELFKELQTFKSTFRRSFDGVCKQPFAKALINTIEEAQSYTNVHDCGRIPM